MLEHENTNFSTKKKTIFKHTIQCYLVGALGGKVGRPSPWRIGGNIFVTQLEKGVTFWLLFKNAFIKMFTSGATQAIVLNYFFFQEKSYNAHNMFPYLPALSEYDIKKHKNDQITHVKVQREYKISHINLITPPPQWRTLVGQVGQGRRRRHNTPLNTHLSCVSW